MRPLHKHVCFIDPAIATATRPTKKRKQCDSPFFPFTREADWDLRIRNIPFDIVAVRAIDFPSHLPHRKGLSYVLENWNTDTCIRPTLFYFTSVRSRGVFFREGGTLNRLFDYDYGAMRTAMDAFRLELLRYVMGPSQLARLPGLGLMVF